MECATMKPACAHKRNKRILVSAIALAALGAGWYAFRPEKLVVNQAVSESALATAAMTQTLARGQFHGVAHDTKGQVSVTKLSDGRRVLRFEGFETSNGPDLRVLLVAANDAMDSAAVKSADRVEIAPLKGNIGDQNYELPADVDLGKFQAVTVWCNRFGVNFATAPLMMGS